MVDSTNPVDAVLMRGPEAPPASGSLASRLVYRMSALCVLLALEITLFSVAFDTARLTQTGFVSFIGDWAPQILRAAVAFAALFAVLLFQTSKPAIDRVSRQLPANFLSARWLAIHAAAILALAGLSRALFAGVSTRMPLAALAAVWLITGVFSVAAGIAIFIPVRLGLQLFQSTARAWIPAAIGGVLTCFAGYLTQGLWKPAVALTFHMVTALLRPLVHGLILDPGSNVIGTSKFQVSIAPSCSGLEGVGLMLIFSVVWIWLSRNESRFPHVLAIIPASAILIFLLNSVRIAALILIGNAGAEGIALGGFHSQAGWIAFNATAVALMLTLSRVPWFATGPAVVESPVAESPKANPTAWYLAPFLAILIASMLSKAASNSFEWAYPLRFLVGAAVLYHYRKRYYDLDWRAGWAGLIAGIAAFALWMGWEWVSPSPSNGAIGVGLASLPGFAKFSWIAFRVLAATVTVPIAEELAFRGFLLRRFISEDFERVRFQAAGLFPILASSAAFGALHGSRWPVGILAGVIYALALRRRGRIGDAVAAHAITNALLAAWVLSTGHWNLW